LAVHGGGGIEIRRAVGKLRNLEGLLLERPLEGAVGIGHTRWATHGRPSEANAHPHLSGDIAVVHNGIIENHVALRRELKSEGFEILSETDTELVAHLVKREVRAGKDLVSAVLATIAQLQGAYAIAV